MKKIISILFIFMMLITNTSCSSNAVKESDLKDIINVIELDYDNYLDYFMWTNVTYDNEYGLSEYKSLHAKELENIFADFDGDGHLNFVISYISFNYKTIYKSNGHEDVCEDSYINPSSTLPLVQTFDYLYNRLDSFEESQYIIFEEHNRVILDDGSIIESFYKNPYIDVLSASGRLYEINLLKEKMVDVDGIKYLNIKKGEDIYSISEDYKFYVNDEEIDFSLFIKNFKQHLDIKEKEVENTDALTINEAQKYIEKNVLNLSNANDYFDWQYIRDTKGETYFALMLKDPVKYATSYNTDDYNNGTTVDCDWDYYAYDNNDIPNIEHGSFWYASVLERYDYEMECFSSTVTIPENQEWYFEEINMKQIDRTFNTYIVNARGFIYELNIPDSLFKVMDEDICGVSPLKLGRYVTLIDENGLIIYLFENGYKYYEGCDFIYDKVLFGQEFVVFSGLEKYH